MATQQFESAKKLILHFTQKNCMNPESDIKGVMPGEYCSGQPAAPPRPGGAPPDLGPDSPPSYQAAVFPVSFPNLGGGSATRLGMQVDRNPLHLRGVGFFPERVQCPAASPQGLS